MKYNMIFVQKGDKGKKVCATEFIKKDTVISCFEGKIIDYKKTLELGNKESFALQIDNNKYIYLDIPYRYFNHSCEPNCGLRPDLKLVALTDLEKGEELTYDYSTTMLEHHWKMECSCHKPSCRKIIADFDTLPKDLRQHYISLNIVQTFIIKALYPNVSWQNKK